MADLSSTDRRNAHDSESSANDLASLYDKLDTLWIRYLDLVDQYQAAQNDLQKQLSSGFFSLAQANFKSPNRRPYGQDFYDQRMKATRLCHFRADDNEAVNLSFKSHAPSTAVKKADEEAKSKERQPQQEPSPPATPEPEPEQPAISATDGKTNDEDAEHETKDDETSKIPPNPIRWFGILVPQELRRAQSSFTSALDGPGSESAVTRAANTARAMRGLEIEIGRCRKAIRKVEEKVQKAG